MASRSARLRALAKVLTGERKVTAAMKAALTALLREAARALAAAGYDTAVLDGRWPAWRAEVDGTLIPAVEDVFTSAWTATQRSVIDPAAYATRHIEAVHNRLVGVSDEVFDAMRLTLEEGRQAQESIPQLAARVDGLLADEQRWAGRARTIARTEVIAANNAGARGAARATADLLGVHPGAVARVWLATGDGRTRETHAEADGQVVIGLDSAYTVGGADLDGPGDPYGPAEEVINCRCTELFYYPGDPEYDALAGTTTPTALAAAAQEDPVTTTPPETDPAEEGAEDAPSEPSPDGTPTHAGMAVQAADTGRVLMIQRSLDQDDPPEVRGTWEFPGGGIEDGEDALTAAWREFSEETGLPQPDGEVTATWVSDDGVYAGHVCTVPVEAEAFSELNPDLAAAETVNPDDPQRRNPGVSAWFTVEQAQNLGPALRPEVAAMDWSVFAPAPEEDTMTQQTPDAVAAAAGDPAPVPVDQDPIEPGLQMDGPDLGDQFYGVAVVEDSQTGDGRVFAPGSITWDTTPLPVPLGWQVQDAMGHDGSVICGRVDTYFRVGTNLVAYTGTWDLDGAGWETRRLVEDRFLTGVSVDTDDFDAVVVDQNGNPVDPFLGMMGEDDDAVLLVNGARLRSQVMCRVPAFVEAFIANGTPPPGWAGERPGAVPVPADDTGTPAEEPAPEDAPMPTEEEATAALVAAAERAGNPPQALPDAGDFADPGLTGPTPITVTDDGRVYGHIATWGTCHIGLDGCVTPPSSRSAYAYFLTGEVETTAGWIPVGQITMGTGHAPTSMSARPAAAHYDNTGFAVADVFCGEDETGIWIAGRLRAGVDAAKVSALRAAGALSGDWRKIGGNLELVAALAVNVPGFPVPRLSVAASAGEPVALVAAGMVPHDAPVDESAVRSGERRLLSFSDVYAAIDRRDRARAAAARLDARRAEARRARVASLRDRMAGRA